MKNTLARCVLVIFVLLQVTFPLRAYAVAPIAVAAYVSVAAHASLLLLKLNGLSFGTSSSSSGAGGNDSGRMNLRLDGNANTPVPDWPSTAGSSAGSASVPPQSSTPQSVAVPRINYWLNGINGPFVYVPTNPAPTPQQFFEKMRQLCAMRSLTYTGGALCYAPKGGPAVQIHNSGEVNNSALACPDGYAMSSSGDCILFDPDIVKKPSGVKCEAIFKNGQFQFDPSNPACDGKTKVAESNGCETEVSAGVYKLNCVGSSVNVSPSAITYQTPQGSGSVPVSVVDGALSITVPSDKPMQFPGGFLPVTVDQIGTYSCDSYGLCVPAGVSSGGSSSGDGTSGASTGGGSSIGGSAGGSSGGAGAGSSDGSGSGTGSGSDSGAGSSTGTSKTTLDDSAFQAMGDKVGKAGADGSGADDGAFDTLKKGLSDKLGFLDSFRFNWVPVPRDFAQCKPIPYAVLGMADSWNICQYVGQLTQAMGYLFYVFTAIYLYRLFTSSSKD